MNTTKFDKMIDAMIAKTKDLEFAGFSVEFQTSSFYKEAEIRVYKTTNLDFVPFKKVPKVIWEKFIEDIKKIFYEYYPEHKKDSNRFCMRDFNGGNNIDLLEINGG